MTTYTSDSVLVAEAAVLYAPLATALPDETSVAWNTFAGWTGWTMLGYTTVATEFSYSYDVFEVDVQQSLAPIKRRKISEVGSISTSLAQFEGALLALVLSGTNTTVAAGASQKAWDRVVFGGDPALDEYMFAIEGWREDSAGTKQPVRIFGYRGTITANGGIPFDKNAVTAIPIAINLLADSSKAVGAQLGEIHVITAPASS